MRSAKMFALAISAILPLGFLPVIHAATITSGATTVVASGGVAPGASSNYEFFGGHPTALTDFTVSTGDNATFSGFDTYSSITAPDNSGPFFTGIVYDGPCACGETTVLATFNSRSDGDFNVFLLDANTDGLAVGNVSVGLGVNGGAEVSSVSQYYSGTNEFTEFSVTGATTDDEFQVYATGDLSTTPGNTEGGNNHPSLGGITFSTITPSAITPEPGTISLLGTGLMGLAGVARRRLRK